MEKGDIVAYDSLKEVERVSNAELGASCRETKRLNQEELIVKLNMVSDLLDDVIKEIKSDRSWYDWHDLRVDPSVVPNDKECVIIKSSLSSIYYIVEYCAENKIWMVKGDNSFFETAYVLAWRGF